MTHIQKDVSFEQMNHLLKRRNSSDYSGPIFGFVFLSDSLEFYCASRKIIFCVYKVFTAVNVETMSGLFSLLDIRNRRNTKNSLFFDGTDALKRKRKVLLMYI